MSWRARLLLALHDEGYTLARWRGGRCVEQLCGPNSEAGRASCRRLLTRHAGLPLSMVLDTAAEEYRMEVLPHARGSARRELVARRLRQQFPDTPFCDAVLAGRSAAGRRDDRYQFAACLAPQALAPWVTLVEDSAVLLAGIHLLPTVCEPLVRRLARRAPHVLALVTTSSGLRVLYCHDGRLHSVRRQPPVGGSAEHRAAAYLEIIGTTRLYLDAVQAVAVDQPLMVVLIDPQDLEATTARHIAAARPAYACLHAGSAALMQALKIGDAARVAEADASLFLHLLAWRIPALNLAPASVRGSYAALQIRRRVYGVAGVLAALTGVGYLQLHEEAESLARRTRAIAQPTAAAPAPGVVLAPAELPGGVLRDALRVADALSGAAGGPQAAFATAGGVLTHHDGLRLHELDWRRAASPGSVAPGTTPARAQETLELTLEVPDAATAPAALVRVRAFMADLDRSPSVARTRLLRLPAALDPHTPLASHGHSAAEGPDRYTVQVTLRWER